MISRTETLLQAGCKQIENTFVLGEFFVEKIFVEKASAESFEDMLSMLQNEKLAMAYEKTMDIRTPVRIKQLKDFGFVESVIDEEQHFSRDTHHIELETMRMVTRGEWDIIINDIKDHFKLHETKKEEFDPIPSVLIIIGLIMIYIIYWIWNH